PLGRNIDSRFFHHIRRQRIQPFRIDSRAQDVESLACEMPQESLRHLAARRISRAEKQNLRLHVITPSSHLCSSVVPMPFGFFARTNALANFPSTCGAIASTSIPFVTRNCLASFTL